MKTLEQVQDRIHKSRLDWEAGTTPIAREFATGHVRGFGFSAYSGREPAGGGGRMPAQSFAFNNHALPDAVDWRNVDDGDFISPVRDQGQCGSCVAFAVCSVLESRSRIARADPHFSIELSKAHLFFCGTSNGCDNGWHPAAALKRCRDFGVGLERDFPYKGRQQECRQIKPAVHVSRWRRISSANDPRERRECIVRRGPVIAGMVVYSDFLWYKSGVYRPVTSESLGLHAVAVIGFDSDSACWIIKNSWGAAWGEGGFARVGYGTCGIDHQFPFYDPVVVLVDD